MLATADFETSQGHFILKDIKIPKGSVVKNIEECIINTIAETLPRSSPEVHFNLEEHTANVKLTIDENPTIIVSVEYDYRTEEEAIKSIEDGTILKDAYHEFIDYLLDCKFILNIN